MKIALLHPATLLISTFLLIADMQFLSAPWLCGFIALLLCHTSSRPKWAKLVIRNRWLCLGLFCIMAYGLPGDGIAGLDWTPSLNGLTEALTQTLRLITLLGILAILLTHCRHEHLIQGLWVLLQPFVFFGIPTTHIRSSIVRLSLVLESITESKPVPLSDWKQQLTEVFSLDQAPNRGASSEIVLNLQPLLRLDYRVISILALSSIMFIGLAV